MTTYSTGALPKSALLAFVLSSVLPVSFANAVVSDDQMIQEHGQYSNTYLSNWSTLPTGKDYPRKKVTDYAFTTRMGERQTYQNQDSVHISGKYWKVRWNKGFEKYGTTLFHIKNVRKVVIEDMAIIQLDSDWRASHAFLIENCGEVVIRNVYLAGAVHTSHIRVEGSESVFIDNAEIAGYDYGGGQGVRAGQGIYINNGEVAKTRLPSRNLKFSVIQNSYIHGYLKGPGDADWGNQDGINITSASDGILFNNYIENWKSGDAAIDVSHRRNDNAYKNHVFRVERNIVRNSTVAKTSGGAGGSSNHVFGSNNLFINTEFYDYHDGYTNYWVHNTYVASPIRTSSAFFKTQGIGNGGRTVYRNSLAYAYYNAVSAIHRGSDSPRVIDSDYNAFVMPSPGQWFNGIRTFAAWKNQGNDIHSILVPIRTAFVNPQNEDFRLAQTSPAIGVGQTAYLNQGPISMRVTKDFKGTPRDSRPDAGAFEFVTAR